MAEMTQLRNAWNYELARPTSSTRLLSCSMDLRWPNALTYKENTHIRACLENNS